MKTLFTFSSIRILLLLLAVNITPAKGQLSLEHVYPNAGLSSTLEFDSSNQLFLWELEASGWKYVRIDRIGRQIDLFHLDHTYWKSISFNMTSMLNPNAITQDILYISEHLFDLDDGIEFIYTNMYINPGSASTCVTQIVDEETGGLIFDVHDQVASVKPNYHQQQYPIQNTPSGTKLILSGLLNDSAYVYALPGELSNGMSQTWEFLEAPEQVALFPNPGTTELTVLLPVAIPGAQMEIFSGNGHVIQKVSLTGQRSIIDISTLASGHYTCHVQCPDGRTLVNRFIKH